MALTIWEKTSFNIIQKIVIAEYQVDSTGVSGGCACRFSCFSDVPYRIRIKIWLFIIMISYLIVG